MVKKIFLILLIFLILINFNSCKKNVEEKNIIKEKVVKIDSNPQNAKVFIDNKDVGLTPLDIKLKFGKYFLKIIKSGYLEYNEVIEINEGTNTINITLQEEKNNEQNYNDVFLTTGPIIFNRYTLHEVCCSKGFYSYSSIYLNDKVTISGYTIKYINGFEIVFPSGKKVHFELKELPNSDVKFFSKEVLFDEVGRYKVITDEGDLVSTFDVCYKLELISEYDKISDLFNDLDKDKFILVPFNKEVNLTFKVEDAKGNLIKNKELGVYNLKTDNNGLINLKIFVKKEKGLEPFEIFINDIKGNAKIYDNKFLTAYEYLVYDKNGKLIETNSLFPPTYENIKIIEKDNSIYLPLEFLNLDLINLIKPDISSRENNIFIHEKNSNIIYLDSAVSQDGGKTWRKYDLVNWFDTIGVDSDKPNILYAWTNSYKNFLLKSEDYGETFEKIEIPEIDYIEKIIIFKNNIYLATWKGLLKSCDNGKNWEFLIKNEIVRTFNINPKNEKEIIIGTDEKILKTKNGGKNWYEIESKIVNPISIVYDKYNPKIVYIGGRNGVFISKNNGENFDMLGIFYITGKNGVIYNPFDKNIYIASINDGIYKVENYGKKITKINFPLTMNLSNIGINDKNELFVNYGGLPIKINDIGEIIILDNDLFLKENLKINIFDNIIFIDIKSINLETIKFIVDKDKIKIIYLMDLNPY
ncbi:MAG: PEGA domain-containing protein [Caldisericia bacterium]|jgi:hypothetical protein|nr:PEGA domain-containing protein [Caldisericia bacterium]